MSLAALIYLLHADGFQFSLWGIALIFIAVIGALAYLINLLVDDIEDE